MSVKEDQDSKPSQGDLTPRLVRDLKSQHDHLYSQFMKLEQKFSKTQETLSKLQISHSNLEKELSLAKSNQKKIMLQKQLVEKELQDSKDYARKLEQKLTLGGKGPSLAEVNMQLSIKLQELKQDKLEAQGKILKLESENQNLIGKVKSLTLTLENNLNDLGCDVGNNAELVANLANAKESNLKLKEIISDLKEKYEQASYKVEELVIVRESNNEELNRLEEENYKLKIELNNTIKANKELAIDRTALVQCVEEMSAQQKQYELDIELYGQEIEKKSFEFMEKVHQMQKEIDFKDEIIQNKSKNSLKEIESIRSKAALVPELEKENSSLKVSFRKLKLEHEELIKASESREKKLKSKLVTCFQEFDKLMKEKEDIELSNKSKSHEKVLEDRPRQIDDTLFLLNQAKQKNLDLLKIVS
jgi:hypothetical protein